MEVKTIGVVGAGTMGAGIAQVAARAGFQVILRDVAENFVARGLGAIKKNLDRDVQKNRLSAQDAQEIMERISGTVNLTDLAGCDFIIEAIIEQMPLKKELYKQLDEICPPHTIFASNTSGLSITEMAAATKRPAQFIGMHFFNPVPVMKLVEIIKAAETNQETLETTKDLTTRLGKEYILVNESPLFAVNRILVPMLNEAMFVLMEGVASAQDIDKGMMLGANHPIGPLALCDLIGLDVMLMVTETLYQETGDSKYRPCPLLRKMVRAGHLGRKTGRGFYVYNQ
ncbi:MAG: 3-hydroxybutyryl-CoA dehydrogenase [Bacillota bacterium]|uniref:3-hydroxybutyryl-CoA dehydrogenase n=1 Tax=Desulfurispora thermophila TaxID=265470 RepID=UPI0003653ED2|nr:3-hydroxybutyryl-CoA dehydrogenase [Desulfurispora thermophila]